jgi:hypothetical protein
VVSVDDLRKQQAEAFGRFLHAQRNLADLSHRCSAGRHDAPSADAMAPA